jgi:hypothetical protein
LFSLTTNFTFGRMIDQDTFEHLCRSRISGPKQRRNSPSPTARR